MPVWLNGFEVVSQTGDSAIPRRAKPSWGRTWERHIEREGKLLKRNRIHRGKYRQSKIAAIWHIFVRRRVRLSISRQVTSRPARSHSLTAILALLYTDACTDRLHYARPNAMCHSMQACSILSEPTPGTGGVTTVILVIRRRPSVY